MRISTNTLYDSGAARLTELQSAMQKTQQQISTGSRLLTPADDPVAAARALQVSQSQAANTQFTTNRAYVKDALSQEETTLQSLTLLIQGAQTSVVAAGNGALDDSQRKDIATTLQESLNQLMGIANTQDGVGNYLFAGNQITSPPFAQTPNGVSYSGDQGQRQLQVGPARQMAVNDPGNVVFDNNRTGNGTFVTGAAGTVSGSTFTPTNTGSGIISAGSVVNSAQLTGDSYAVNFHVAAGVTTYDVVDTTTGNPALDPSTGLPITGAPYTSGQAIAFDGMQFDIQGSPADGDQFTVAPSANQSLFSTMTDIINALNSSGSGTPGQANLTNTLNAANTNLGNALNNVLSIRASLGARLTELDSLDTNGSNLDLQYSSSLASLQGLDYAQAISSLNLQQTTLTAAQQSFAKIAGLSLFNYL